MTTAIKEPEMFGIEEKDGLRIIVVNDEFKIHNSSYFSHKGGAPSVEDGFLRRLFSAKGAVFNERGLPLDPAKQYAFLRATPNPDAIAFLESHIEPANRFMDPRPKRFMLPLSELYNSALAHLANAAEIRSAKYPLVLTGDVHFLDLPREYSALPVVHVVEGEAQVPRFRELAGKLNDSEAYQYITKREEPQRYQMENVDLIRSKGISPLVLEETVEIFSGKELLRFMNSVLPFSYVQPERHTGPAIEVD